MTVYKVTSEEAQKQMSKKEKGAHKGSTRQGK
jgi:hypothetical protein